MAGPDRSYPEQHLDVMAVGSAFDALFEQPTGVSEWPPTQVAYLRHYVSKLDCQTAVVERHYVDRDFIHDVAVLYARSLRSYPNYCQRIHLFRSEFNEERWRQFVISSSDPAARASAEAELNAAYLGFIVVKPLPGVPVGRTVLRTWGPNDAVGNDREFPAIRPYEVHLGPFHLQVDGLAFQQQDSGVSACATTALWSALHRVAYVEGLATRTPAEITEAASKYVLADGRALPSEGLTVDQVCEAIRAAGLSPLLLRPVDRDQDVGQIVGYLRSGFPVVLGLKSIDVGTGADGHAVCVTGIKLAALRPQADPTLHCIDGATRVKSLFIHDDRLGPYAVADVHPWTDAKTQKTKTALWITWPDKDKTETEHSLLTAIIVPVPIKLRLTIGRLRELALGVAENMGAQFPEAKGHAVFNCRFERASDYRHRALGFGLTDDAVFNICCETVLSRYIGLIEVSSKDGEPLLDVVLDSTETGPNPAILGWVRRSGLAESARAWLEGISEYLGGAVFW